LDDWVAVALPDAWRGALLPGDVTQVVVPFEAVRQVEVLVAGPNDSSKVFRDTHRLRLDVRRHLPCGLRHHRLVHHRHRHHGPHAHRQATRRSIEKRARPRSGARI